MMLNLFSKEKQSKPSNPIYGIAINRLNGEPLVLNEFKGKFLLIVNVASECGFTPQYESLQKLYENYKETLEIIGVPCNQFGSQEPGSSKDIENFCQINYGVSFTITEKIKVKGSEQHPLYQWLTQKKMNGSQNSNVRWNFQKYLISPEGEFIDYYYSITNPLSQKIIKHLK